VRLFRRLSPLFIGGCLAFGVPAGEAGEQVEFREARPGDPSRAKTITATLERPEGEGPFAAAVLLHGCAGILDNDRAWARTLVGERLVTLLVDSFTNRGIEETCGAASGGSAAGIRVWDALGALKYLRGLPFVRADRIAVIGWSEGGAVAIRAGQNALATYALKAPGFTAIAAFYPPCSDLSDDVKAPLLLLLAGKDDWVSPVTCVQRAEAGGKDRRIEHVMYPNATHAFDLPAVGEGTQHHGHTLRYDAEATRDASARLTDFIRRTLQ
jgi:dienelactone hydrolase